MANHLISISRLCSQYEVEFSFVDALQDVGLIQFVIVKKEPFLHEDQLGQLEKIIRLHHELNVNVEGIDVIFNLLEKQRRLRAELQALKNRLRLYESEVNF